jgi:hypothetical protein
MNPYARMPPSSTLMEFEAKTESCNKAVPPYMEMAPPSPAYGGAELLMDVRLLFKNLHWETTKAILSTLTTPPAIKVPEKVSPEPSKDNTLDSKEQPSRRRVFCWLPAA